MSGSHTAGQPGPDTTFATLLADNPAALDRLAGLHPAFGRDSGPALGVPPEASLSDIARAAGLPLDAVLSAARGEIRVQVAEGAGCGCGCGH